MKKPMRNKKKSILKLWYHTFSYMETRKSYIWTHISCKPIRNDFNKVYYGVLFELAFHDEIIAYIIGDR